MSIDLSLTEREARVLILAVEHALLAHPSGQRSDQLANVRRKLAEQGIEAPVLDPA